MLKRPIRNFLIPAAGLLYAHVAGAQPNAFADVDEYLANAVATTPIPGLVAMVVGRDEVLYASAHGRRDVANDAPMTLDTIFRIASMTKPIAATAIMMLVEEGKLDLDEPIATYLPEFAEREVLETFDRENGTYTSHPASNPITIRHLLSHSSGLAYGFASDVVAALDDGSAGDPPLLYEPGAGWSYAGGIGIVGGVLERIEGVGLDTFLRERLFRPLGMHDTSFIVPARSHFRVATVHRTTEDGRLVEIPNPIDIRAAVSGDGGLHSTAVDYVKFIQLFLNRGVAPSGRRIISEASIEEMRRNQLARPISLQDEPLPLLARAFPLGAGRDGFGLGFQVTGQHRDPGTRSPGSMSWAGIYNTEFWIDPRAGIGGVLLMQYLPFYDDSAIDTLEGFESRVYEDLASRRAGDPDRSSYGTVTGF